VDGNNLHELHQSVDCIITDAVYSKTKTNPVKYMLTSIFRQSSHGRFPVR